MPQLSYSNDQGEAFAGMKADSRFDEVESFQTLDALDFGVGVVAGEANPATECRLPDTNKVVITDNAGTWTAGDVVATVNGTDVTESFDTDKDTSMTNLAASIQALATVSSAAYVAGSHTITVLAANDVSLTITVDVSGITGTMTISSITGTCEDTVRGIALHSHQTNRTIPTLNASSYTAAGYVATDPVNVLRKGVAWVNVADAVVIDSAAYLITAGSDIGKFTDDSSSPNIAVPTGVFRSATSGAGIAKLEINIP